MSSPVKVIETRRFEDARGWFVETWSQSRWAEQGVASDFVQDNQSLSRAVGTIRGIHYQLPPHAQGKLVRCPRGRVMDYAIDLRGGSPTYGKSVGVELSADNGRQLWVPVGFGHAFVTLEPDTEIVYKVTSLYNGGADAGVRWDCPTIGIDWPVPSSGPVLSDKDVALPTLSEIAPPFVYDGLPLGAL